MRAGRRFAVADGHRSWPVCQLVGPAIARWVVSGHLLPGTKVVRAGNIGEFSPALPELGCGLSLQRKRGADDDPGAVFFAAGRRPGVFGRS